MAAATEKQKINHAKYRRSLGIKERYLHPQTKLTTKQLKFAEAIAAGQSSREAAKQAGFKSAGSAYHASTNPLVQQYISSVRAETRAIVAYGLAQAMDEALRALDFAYEKSNPMAVVKATELRAKLSGLLVDKVEVVTVDITKALEAARNRVITVQADIKAAPCLADTQADSPSSINPINHLP